MQRIVDFVRSIYITNETIGLHEPRFGNLEKQYLTNVIDSTFVSSVGKYVDQFEDQIGQYTNSVGAVAVVNGTSALHTSLHALNVGHNDLVITQAVSFVATANAIRMTGADPVFIDIAKQSLSLCPKSLSSFLSSQAQLTNDGRCLHNATQKEIKAIIVMHTFGHPAMLDELITIAKRWGISLIEDAAESLGSFYKGQHTGTFGVYGALSFNGNKIITTGGGGMILTQDTGLAKHIKHITTTAKVAMGYEFYHDMPGFNYRMPNINAAVGCAQFSSFQEILKQKRQLAKHYQDFFNDEQFTFVTEPDYAKSNYWLNAVICKDPKDKTRLLEYTNSNGIMTRPLWQLLHTLPMYQSALCGDLSVSEWLAARCVCLPSGTYEKVSYDD